MSVWGRYRARRPSALLAAAALGALALSACGAAEDGTAAGSPSAEQTTPQAASSAVPDGTEPPEESGPSSAASSGSAEATGQGRGGDCTTDMLKAAMTASGQEMNSKYFDLTLTNTGGGPCTLKGYAGLSLTDPSGEPIGEPATRSQDGAGSGGPVTIEPGKAAHAVVKTPGKDVTDGKCWKKPSKIRVYPPNNTAALSAPAPGELQVCGDTFTVGPFASEAS